MSWKACRRVLTLGVAGFVLASAACPPSNPPENTEDAGPSLDRVVLLETLVHDVIQPDHELLVTRTEALNTSIHSLCANTNSANLDDARQKWRDAQDALKLAEPHSFGPMDELRLTNALDFWPVRTDVVEQYIAAATEPYDDYVSSLGTAGKGLPVAEYLLFGTDPTQVLGALTASPSRCGYLEAVSGELNSAAQRLRDSWRSDGGYYVPLFVVEPSQAKKSVDVVVNELIGLCERIADIKVGVPMGKKNGGVPQPTEAESRFSHHSIENIRNNIEGISRVWRGAQDPRAEASLSSALRQVNPELDDDVLSALTTLESSVDAVTLSLEETAEQSPATLQSVFDAAKNLQRLLAVDVASALGVTLTFNDNDGD